MADTTSPSSLYEADGILGTAISTVTDKLQELDLVAERYNEKLSSVLTNIGSITVDDVEAPDLMTVPETPTPSVDLSDMPELNVPTLSIPSMPSASDIDSLLADLDVGDFDVPDEPDAIPFSVPDSPTMASIPVPDRPNVDTNVEIPDAPSIAMPGNGCAGADHHP